MLISHRTSVVARLGTAQTLAWASSYYLPAMLATSMAADLGVSVTTVFAAFSFALIVSAVFGRWAGQLIDLHGGRPVLIGTNLLFAAGLLALALAQGPVLLFLAWGLIGVAMAAGLYDAAFATLVRLYGHDARSSITGITLIAGFASTVGWPLTAWLELEFGWRGACLCWAGLHLLLGLPLNASLPRSVAAPDVSPVVAAVSPTAVPEAARAPGATFWPTVLLSLVFAVTWFTSTAMAAHLPSLLQAHGLTLAAALALAALVGPAQVAARLLEFGFLRKVHPLLSAQLATAAHPLGAVLLMVVGGPAALLFTVLHGAGNGILTIAKGTLPLVIFGPKGYGARQGLLMVPARVAQAFAPLVFGLAIDQFGGGALWVSTGVGLVGLAALVWLQRSGSVVR
ncbi:MFS transporter [Hydrogenophaga aromaticivorans]|uniref:MFS transporter n=1 Tax=Hydrogenophaga aromaticivorans TaxID=2610898 RepID=UPI001B37BF2A|nr:MFS transporter [Hydrogenophaga aromaticivorans]MBQ0917123.1 MFS transporter [Hydrogenophaga aromaticivorans]